MLVSEEKYASTSATPDEACALFTPPSDCNPTACEPQIDSAEIGIVPESEYDSESKMVALESCCLNLGSDAESISVATRPGRDPKKGSVPDCVPDCNPCVNNSAEACVPNVPLAGTMQQVGCYIYFVGRSRNCFSMKVPIRLSNGVEVIAHVLVDDGAELVLFGSGFIDDIGDQLWQKPEQKVNLVVANQTLLGGGSRECSLDLKFLCQRFDGRFSGTKYFSTFAYEADNFSLIADSKLSDVWTYSSRGDGSC